MSTQNLTDDIMSILPTAPTGPNATGLVKTEAMVKENAERIAQQKTARELAALKQKEQAKLEREKARLEREKEKLDRCQQLGIPVTRTELQHERIQEQEAKIELIEALEEENQGIQTLIHKNLKPAQVRQLADIQGATRPEVLKLLQSLNINLNLALTKTDTANLLACLLTCNEQQLDALYKNKKIPVAVKTVIKRLKEDATLGNIDTIERLWDRVFGKAAMSLDLPNQDTMNGIIPNTPISREAYLILRDTYMK